MKNKYGISFTAKDIEALNDITQRVNEARAEAYERAVKLYTQSEGEKASVLSQKISEEEKKNLVIARPRKVDIDIEEIRSKAEFNALLRSAKLNLKYEARARAETYAENFITTLEKVYGSETAKQVANTIRKNPQALLDAVNARSIKSIGFTYLATDEQRQQVVDDIKKALRARRK